MSKTYNTPAEIEEDFIKKGWSKNTTFTEITFAEARKGGYLGIIDKICKGRKYFKMNVCGNIYDDNGKIVYYNVPCISKEREEK